MRNQSSSDAQSVFFKFPLPHLWVFTPAFMMIYPYFYDDIPLLLWWYTPGFRMIYFWFYDDLLLLLGWFTSAFMMLYSCFYDDLLLLLGWFTPTFMIRWFNIAWIAVDIALMLFLPLIAVFSSREYKIFRPGKYLVPAERILCSIREPTTFLMRMKCILVKNEVYSRKECTSFS